LKVTELG